MLGPEVRRFFSVITLKELRVCDMGIARKSPDYGLG